MNDLKVPFKPETFVDGLDTTPDRLPKAVTPNTAMPTKPEHEDIFWSDVVQLERALQIEVDRFDKERALPGASLTSVAFATGWLRATQHHLAILHGESKSVANELRS